MPAEPACPAIRNSVVLSASCFSCNPHAASLTFLRPAQQKPARILGNLTGQRLRRLALAAGKHNRQHPPKVDHFHTGNAPVIVIDLRGRCSRPCRRARRTQMCWTRQQAERRIPSLHPDYTVGSGLERSRSYQIHRFHGSRARAALAAHTVGRELDHASLPAGRILTLP